MPQKTLKIWKQTRQSAPDNLSVRYGLRPESDKPLQEVDLSLMWAVGVLGKATIPHFATFLALNHWTLRKRIKSLVRRGYVLKSLTRSLHEKDVYGLGSKGYRVLVREAGIPAKRLTVFEHAHEVSSGYLNHLLLTTDVIVNAYAGLPAIGQTLCRWQRELWLPTRKNVDIYLCTASGDQEFHWLVETDNRDASKFDHDMTPQFAALWKFWHLLKRNEDVSQKFGFRNFRVLTTARDPDRLPRLKAQAQAVYGDNPFGPLMFWFASHESINTPQQFTQAVWSDTLGRMHRIGE